MTAARLKRESALLAAIQSSQRVGRQATSAWVISCRGSGLAFAWRDVGERQRFARRGAQGGLGRRRGDNRMSILAPIRVAGGRARAEQSAQVCVADHGPERGTATGQPNVSAGTQIAAMQARISRAAMSVAATSARARVAATSAASAIGSAPHRACGNVDTANALPAVPQENKSRRSGHLICYQTGQVNSPSTNV